MKTSRLIGSCSAVAGFVGILSICIGISIGFSRESLANGFDSQDAMIWGVSGFVDDSASGKDAYGTEVDILRVTSDNSNGFTNIKLVLDNEYNLVGLRRYIDGTLRMEFSLAQLVSGAVLEKQDSYEVIKLFLKGNTPSSGGVMQMVYLTNGLFNSHDQVSVELVRTGQQWKVQTNDQSGRREVHNMSIKTNKWFGKVVGVESISFN